MDKTQSKLVELTENLTALEVCLSNGRLGYPELILFLQYDIPLEQSCNEYASMKRVFHDLNPSGPYLDSDRYKKVITIMRNLQDYIVENDRNGNQIRVVYKQATDIAEQICIRLDNEQVFANINAHYPEKAAD